MSGAAAARGGGRGGVFWSSLNGAGSVILPFGVFAAFAHLLSPVEFAHFGLALACAELLKTIGPMGLYDVLIAHGEDEVEFHRTAAAVFLIGALMVMAVFAIVLVVSDSLFHIRLTGIAHLLGLKILFDYLLLQPQAVLVRRGDVRRLGLRSLVAGIISGVGGLAMGLAFSPLFGLAAYYVLSAGITLAMTVTGTGAMMRPGFFPHCFAQMRKQAVWSSGVRFAGGVNSYLDQLVIGRTFSALSLGQYNLGKRMEVSIMTLASSLSQILWQPAFARARIDQRQDELGKALASVALVCGVPVLALAVTADRAVPVLFGRHWAGAAPVVALLALSGLARAINSVGGAMFAVTSRNGMLLWLSLLAAGMNFLIIIGFAPYGLVFTATAIVVRNFLHALLTMSLLAEVRPAVPRLVFANLLAPLGLVLALMLALSRAMAWLPAPAEPLLNDLYAIAVVAGGGAVAGLLLLLRRI